MLIITLLGLILCVLLLLLAIDEHTFRRRSVHKKMNYAYLEMYADSRFLSKKQKALFSSKKFKRLNGYDTDTEDYVPHGRFVHYVSCGRYPICSGQYTIGRKSGVSLKRIDILGPANDTYERKKRIVGDAAYPFGLSENSSTLFLEKGEFFLKLHKQTLVWVRDYQGNVTPYVNPVNPPKKEFDRPPVWVDTVCVNPAVKSDVVPLHFGDSVIMGSTLFEFVSSARNAKGGGE